MPGQEIYKKDKLIDNDKLVKVESYAFSIDEDGKNFVVLRFSGDTVEKPQYVRFVLAQYSANNEKIAEGEVICDKIVKYDDGTFSPKAQIPVFEDCEGISVDIIEVKAGRYRYDGYKDKIVFNSNSVVENNTAKRITSRSLKTEKSKTPKAILISAIILTIAIVATAIYGFGYYKDKTDSFIYEGIVYKFDKYDFENGDLKVAGLSRFSLFRNKIVIPESIDGKTVTEISEGAFKNNNNISEIVLNGKIRKIGSYAFSGCAKLKAFDFEGIEEVKEHAFSNSGIEQVVSSTIENIGNNAFAYCTGLKKIDLAIDRITVGSEVFSYCDSLDEVSFNRMVIEGYDKGVFKGSAINELNMAELPYSSNMLSRMTLPQLLGVSSDYGYYSNRGSVKNVTIDKISRIDNTLCYNLTQLETFTVNEIENATIGREAFYNCSSLRQLSLNKSVGELGENALYNCAITEFDGSSLTQIGSGAFYGCKNISDYPLYRNLSITEIPQDCFKDCTSLRSVIMPGIVTNIGARAFSGCKNLAEISVEQVSDIGDSAFSGCTSLRSVVISDIAESIGYGLLTGDENVEYISVPFIGTNRDYTANLGYLFGNQSIPSKLKEVSVTNSYMIWDNCFSACTNLQKVTIDSAEYIGSYAFSGCKNLKTVSLPYNLEGIGSNAFYDCIKLYEVLNDSAIVLTKGSYDYGGVAQNAIYIGSAKEPMPRMTNSDYVFAQADEDTYLIDYLGSGKNIVLPDRFEYSYKIPNYLFFESNIESIVISDYVTDIGLYAFAYCSNLKTINFNYPSITEIKSNCFRDCTSLEKIVLPDDVERIGDSAFANCTSIESVTLPSVLNYIESNAFNNCGRLYEVYDLTPNIDVVSGSYDNGYVGLNALFIHIDRNETAMRKTTVSGVEYRYCDGEYHAVGGNGTRSMRINASVLPDADSVYIPSFLFAGNSTIEQLTFDYIVKDIGQNAFDNCSSLRTLNADPSFSVIRSNTFAYCTSLREVDLGANIVGIENGAFSNCYELRKITIRGTLNDNYIDTNAFYNCENIYEIYNLSGIPLAVGSTRYGKIAVNALKIHTNSYEAAIKYAEYNGFEFAYYDYRWNLYKASADFMYMPDKAYSGSEEISSYYILARAVFGASQIYLPVSVLGAESGAFNNAYRIYYAGTEYEWQTNSSKFSDVLLSKVRYYKACIHEGETDKYWRRSEYSGTITVEQTPENYSVKKLSTCNESGYEEYTCEHCGRTFRRDLDKQPHTIENSKCKVCKTQFAENKITASNYSALGLSLRQNNSSYGFEFSDGSMVSGNKGIDNSYSEMVFTAQRDAQIVFIYDISSEMGCDAMKVYINGSLTKDDSGSATGEVSLLLKAGDKVAIRYDKDGSASNGRDDLLITDFYVYYIKG